MPARRMHTRACSPAAMPARFASSSRSSSALCPPSCTLRCSAGKKPVAPPVPELPSCSSPPRPLAPQPRPMGGASRPLRAALPGSAAPALALPRAAAAAASPIPVSGPVMRPARLRQSSTTTASGCTACVKCGVKCGVNCGVERGSPAADLQDEGTRLHGLHQV
eukprot:352063-Chlamydomonas_euryale.AAC.1